MQSIWVPLMCATLPLEKLDSSEALTVALLQVCPPSMDVLYSKSPPGAQPIPPSVGSWHAPCDLEYHACIVLFCRATHDNGSIDDVALIVSTGALER